MSKVAADPAWKRDDGTGITLSGSWSLLVDRHRRRRLLRDFAELGDPDAWHWDLRGVAALDSTGALLLWEAWHDRLPQHLECSDAQRHLFAWLAGAAPVVPPSRHAGGNWLERLGRGVWLVLATGGGIFLLAGQLILDFGFCLRHPRAIPWREISANIRHVGAGGVLLVGSIGFLIGAVMTIQIGFVFQIFGAVDMVIGMMATAAPRELGAVVVGLLMAGRTGSAMTASIGAMHITQEYSALRAFGISPTLRLALPRVIGAAISMPLLVIWTDCTVVLGSALAAQAQLGIGSLLYLQQFVEQVQLVNFWIGFGKGVLFGVVISLVGCYFGMSASPDTESMSNHTTLSVVTSLTAILLLDASLGAALTNVGLL